mgnify:FL=1
MKIKTLSSFVASLVAGTTLCATSGSVLQQEVDAARRAKKNSVTLTQKEYRIPTGVNLTKFKDFTIDGNGAKIVITNPRSQAFVLWNSTDITIKNLTVDYDPLPYTQGVITAIDGKELKFTIDAGYPRLTPELQLNYIHIFTPDGRRWKENCPDVYGKLKMLSPDEGIFTMRKSYDVEIGDRFAVNYRSPAAFDINRCGKVTFEDITIQASPGVAFLSRYGHGEELFHRVKIIRGTPPTGATAPRLLAGNADGINIASNRGGVSVRDCEFSYLGDDSINLHCELMPLVSKVDEKVIDTVYPYPKSSTFLEEVYTPGDRVIFVRSGDYSVIGEAKIARIEVSPRSKAVASQTPDFFPVHSTRGFTVYEVEFDRPVNFPEGSFFYVPVSSAQGFEIVNNYFHDHRARGLRLMSSNGVVENNRFERLKSCAIALGGEFNWWREAGWCENIAIRNNKMIDIGWGSMASPDNYVPAVVATFARLDQYPGFYHGNRNLEITGNEIKNAPGAGILLNYCDGVKVSGNTIENVLLSKEVPGRDKGFKDPTPVWIQNSVNIEVQK